MNSDQIWEQLELKTKNVLKVLESIVTPEIDDAEGSGDSNDSEGDAYGDDQDGNEMDMDLDAADLDKYDSSDDSDYIDDERMSPDGDNTTSDEGESGGHGEESIASLRPGIDERPDIHLDRPGQSSTGSKR
jgi:hypothetical protein